jgi:hypothetical protein
MGGTCRSEGRNNKFIVGNTGNPYNNETRYQILERKKT